MKNGSKGIFGGTEFWDNDYKPYISYIKFDNDVSKLPNDCTLDNLCFDVTDESSSKKVYAYLLDNGKKDSTEHTLYDLYIVSESTIFAPNNCYSIFGMFGVVNGKYIYNLDKIDFNNNFNTSNTTNMNFMFWFNGILKDLDLSSFNTSNVTNMECMFYNCSKLQTTINILNASTTYTDIFAGNALTDTNANVIIGYTAETKAIAEAMKETAGSNKSKITLKQI